MKPLSQIIFAPSLFFANLLRAFAKETCVYDCPACKNEIKYAQKKCSQCQESLEWDSPYLEE